MLNRLERVDRAKLFLSFDALKGFKEFLKEKERVIVARKELLEDTYEELDWKINQIRFGRIAKIVYYDKNEYISVEGMVTDIDLEVKQSLMIVDKIISIKDIVEIHDVIFE